MSCGKKPSSEYSRLASERDLSIREICDQLSISKGTLRYRGVVIGNK